MPTHLCLSVTFLDPAFHGRGDGGEPEWPPSPLRLFQALLAAAAARWGPKQFADYAVPALAWLERQSPPEILTPSSIEGSPYRLSVPNNAMDIVGRAWSRGNDSNSGDANPATHRAMKTVRPTHLVGGDQVHFVWELADSQPDDLNGHVEVLSTAARSLVALGWGVDLVAGYARVMTAEEASRLAGHRWQPTSDPAAAGLRVPTPGTLDDLVRRHGGFLNRLTGGGFTPVPALSAFATVGYRGAGDPLPRAFAAFQLLTTGAEKNRAYDPIRRTHVVAGMVRHVTSLAARASGWDEARVVSYVLGHGEGRDSQAVRDERFAYVPLPTINPKRVELIRRVLIVGPAGGGRTEVDWARRHLSGTELLHDGKPDALLSVVPRDDRVLSAYTRPAAIWSTVTPVVLPGHDEADTKTRARRRGLAATPEDRRAVDENADARTDELLRRALVQAGYPVELVRDAAIEWRGVGFRAGVEMAGRYEMPPYLKRFPRYHVRLHWRTKTGSPIQVAGPIVAGAGRYRGFGLFAAEADGR